MWAERSAEKGFDSASGREQASVDTLDSIPTDVAMASTAQVTTTSTAGATVARATASATAPLSADGATVPLSASYLQLYAMYGALDSAITLLRCRQASPIFATVRKAVQSQLKQDFTLDHLSRILTVNPAAFHVKRRNTGKRMSDEEALIVEMVDVRSLATDTTLVGGKGDSSDENKRVVNQPGQGGARSSTGLANQVPHAPMLRSSAVNIQGGYLRLPVVYMRCVQSPH